MGDLEVQVSVPHRIHPVKLAVEPGIHEGTSLRGDSDPHCGLKIAV